MERTSIGTREPISGHANIEAINTVKDYKLEVHITPREGLLDPQGKAIEHALHSLAFDGVQGVRVGRLITLKVAADDEATARDRAEEMCRKLLANPVTEDFSIAFAES